MKKMGSLFAKLLVIQILLGLTFSAFSQIPEAEIVATNTEYCGSTSTISLSLQAANGVDLTGATYQWYRNAAAYGTETATLSNVPAGIYHVVISNNSETHTTQDIVIFQHELPTYSLTGGGVFCEGEVIEPATINFLTGTPPFNINYTIDGVVNNLTTMSSVSDFFGTQEGLYTIVSLTDAYGCVAEASSANVTIISNPIPEAEITSIESVYCGTTSTITLSLQAVNGVDLTGATYSWFKNGGAVGTSPNLMNVTEGEYTCQISLNGCTWTTSAYTITSQSIPTYTITGGQSYCSGETINDITIDFTQGTPPFTFSYSIDGAAPVAITNHTSLTYTIPNPTAGIYSLVGTIMDLNCTSLATTVSTEVVINEIPSAPITAGDIELCADSTPITLQAQAISGATLLWYPAASGGTSLGYAPDVQPAVMPSYPYTETYWVSQVVNGCESERARIDVTVNETPPPVVQDVSYCVGSIVVPLSATGTNLQWFDSVTGGTQLPSAPTPSTSSAGVMNYWVTQTQNGCESERIPITVTINQISMPAISAIPGFENCAGEAISLGVSGGSYVSYQWSGSASPYLGSTSIAAPTFLSLLNNIYEISVTVVDANGCSGETSETITVHPNPTATIAPVRPLCINEAPVSIIATTSSSPAAAAFSGTTVNKTSETSATFDPSVAGVGSHLITYDFVSEYGCNQNVPATTTITVNPLPVLSVNYGLDKCDYSTEITPSLSHGMGTVSVSPASAGLNTITGVFDPTVAGVGTYTFTYNYMSPITGCAGLQVTDVLVINPRPVLDIAMNATEFCDYAMPYTLYAVVDGVSNVDGTFSGSGIVGSNFDPTTSGVGTFSISYDYTNPTTGCAGLEVSHYITVKHTVPPIAMPVSEININITDQSTVPEVCADGTYISWYSYPDTTSSIVIASDCYIFPYVDNVGKMAVGVYSMYATQTVNGCQSIPTLVNLTITDYQLPAQAPTVVNYHACYGDAPLNLTAVKSNQAAQLGWWFDSAAIPTNATLGDEDFSGDIWNTHGITSIGTHKVYVAEFNSTLSTYGPVSEIQIDIHDLPNPIIVDPGLICSSTPSVSISYSPSTGSILSGQGLNGANLWTPQFDNTTTGYYTTTLSLDASKTWGTGSDVIATCSNSTTRDIKVAHVLPPSGTGIGTGNSVLWGIVDIVNIPDMDIQYDALVTEVLIYDSINTIIGDLGSLPFNLFPENITSIGHYKYTVIQKTAEGCISEPAISVWDIVDCPTPRPTPTNIEICYGDALPIIPSNAIGQYIEWIDTVGVVIATTQDLDISSFGNIFTGVGTYIFAVSQEDFDLAGGLCRGPSAIVSFKVNPLPEVSAMESIDVFVDKTTIISVLPSDASGSGEWFGTGITKTSETTADYVSSQIGTQTISYVYTNNEGCTSDSVYIDVISYMQQVLTIQDTIAFVSTSGNLANELFTYNLDSIVKLTIDGEINALDIYFMRDSLPNLKILDLTNATIVGFSGNVDATVLKDFMTFAANTLPPSAFKGMKSIEEIYLPKNLIRIQNQAFYNCENLHKVVVPTSNPASIELGSEIFVGVNKTICKIIVPTGAQEDFNQSEVWKEFSISESGGEVLSTNVLQKAAVKMYPNYVDDYVIFENIEAHSIVEIYSQTGNLVVHTNISDLEKVSLKHLLPGVYYAKIGANTFRLIKK